MVGGGAALVAGIACGSVALSTGARLGSDQAFTLREIDALKAQGEGPNGAPLPFDIAAGVALTGGVAWPLAERLRHQSLALVPRPLVAVRNLGNQEIVPFDGKDRPRCTMPCA